MVRITEQSSEYRDLEKMSIEEITACINKEDKTVALVIENALPQINELIRTTVKKLQNGGRMFYLGAGSGGRLSVLDAIEIPNTFGVSKELMNVVLAGGVEHLIEALEEKEDDNETGWKMLKDRDISKKDIVIGIAASGTTPFVLGALTECRHNGITTGCIVSNPDSPISKQADFPVEVITGPEFLRGSTRMKCGTAQKLIFDMISTTTMIQLGRVEDNMMVNVKLVNDKATDRSVRMLMEKAGLSNYDQARTLLLEAGTVKKALDKLDIVKN